MSAETFADYQRRRGVNWSTLKHLADSPLHYRHAVESPSKPPTPAMLLGTAAHLAILEPDRFEESVAVWTEGRRAGKVYEAWQECNAGKVHLKPDEYAAIRAMSAAVRAHPEAAALLRSGQAEQSAVWTDLATGLPCKGRIDWLDVREDRAVIVDLKTARSTDDRAFARQVAALGYHAQLAHYADGVARLTGLPVEVYIVAVESGAPHDVAVFEVDDGIPDGALHVGRKLRDGLMQRLAECVATDRWPGRHESIQSLCLPTWALDDEEITIDGEGADLPQEDAA